MGILNRLWPREVSAPDSDPPLAQRLNELTGSKDGADTAQVQDKPDARDEAIASIAGVTEKTTAAPSEAETTTAQQIPGSLPNATLMETAPLPNAEQDSSQATASPSRPEQREYEPKESEMENRSPDTAPAQDKPENGSQNAASSPSSASTPSTPSNGPGRQFMERFHAAVGRADAGEQGADGKKDGSPDFQSIQKQFESDFRKRLDGALAEFERRVSSQTLVDDITGQIEQRIRVVADGIFKEVKSQAWMMHSAVAGELRSFRDQFAKEIDERVGVLDRSAQNALQMKERLEEALPKAEDALRSLSVSGQEASARFQEAAKVFSDELRASHQELSRGVETQKTALQAMAQDLRRDGQELLEQMEKFRGEAGAAIESLGQSSAQSVEKLTAAAEEAGARTRDGIEKLATEIERRILSGGLVEKATERLARSTEELVEPALERLRQASQAADSSAELLAGASQRVARQLDSARQQIEAKLDGQLSEQLNLLEGAMSGFQRKASEELGSLVERVVTQSTSQMDERLHGMLQDLFVSTSKQINTAARATLSNMHDGLKEAFQVEGAEPDPDSEKLPTAG